MVPLLYLSQNHNTATPNQEEILMNTDNLRHKELVEMHKTLYNMLDVVTKNLLIESDWVPLLTPIFDNNGSAVICYGYGWINEQKTLLVGQVRCALDTNGNVLADTIYPVTVNVYEHSYETTGTAIVATSIQQVKWLLARFFGFDKLIIAKNTGSKVGLPYSCVANHFARSIGGIDSIVTTIARLNGTTAPQNTDIWLTENILNVFKTIFSDLNADIKPSSDNT